MRAMPKHPWIGLVLFLVVCFAAAGIGGAVTTPKIGTWYATLTKPAGIRRTGFLARSGRPCIAAWPSPPGSSGGKAGSPSAKVPLTLFAVQLALNVLWSCIFFGLEKPGLAFGEVLLLWTAIAATIIVFWQRSVIAGILFVPTWPGQLRQFLNFTIWRLNA